jgi:hypothetical protein
MSPKTLILAVCAIAFTGCVLKGPELRVNPPVTVELEGERNGKFCPPGQAKKGRC